MAEEAKWYVVHTYSGYENKVKVDIEKTIENRNLQDQILEVMVPMQTVVEERNGEKKQVQKKMFPAYVLLNMVMNDETWYVVRNTRGVTGFVGPGSKPVPLTAEEITNMGFLAQAEEVPYSIGDHVLVTKGVWQDTHGIGTVKQMKKDMVTEIAATLAFSAIQNNDKIGVIFFSDRIEKFIPPKKGRKHILYIIRELLDFRPESRRTNIRLGLEYLTNVMKRRCTAFVLSDFIDQESFKNAMTIANRKHDVVAIQVYDRRVEELPAVGLMKIKDAETGHEQWIDTSSRAVRRAHRDWWVNKQTELNDTFTKSNVDNVSVRTDQDYVKALMNLFAKRN